MRSPKTKIDRQFALGRLVMWHSPKDADHGLLGVIVMTDHTHAHILWTNESESCTHPKSLFTSDPFDPLLANEYGRMVLLS